MELPDFIPDFLTCVDSENNEMYIFHRSEPQYLIWVKQETPLRFILVEYYDENLTPDYIMAHPSLGKAREYANNLFSKGFDVN